VRPTETLILSLKIISKALASCRESYSRELPSDTVPTIKQVLGPADYASDIETIQRAEALTNALIATPTKISGQALVLVLSISDDVAVHAAGTQTQLLLKLVNDALDRNSQTAKNILLSTSTLSACQTSMFNAGDDYVPLVAANVGAKDDALKRPTK
jgi:hypothetical protein